MPRRERTNKPMPTDTRDARAIAAINCPQCGAKAGAPCRFPPRDGRPACCVERRKANQERLRSEENEKV
jgi:hypothetical protein